MPTTSIASSLGIGSGIDTSSLITSLVDAQFELKTKQFEQRSTTLTAQISAVSQLKSGISGFATALSQLVKGGTLATQPTSSNTGVVTVTAQAGATPASLSASLTVSRLATGQVAASEALPTTATYGTGSFILRLGTATFDDAGAMTLASSGSDITIPVTQADATMADVAAAINAANKGVTAAVVADGGGQRLMLRGATGAASAFTLISADAGLSALNVDGASGGTTVRTRAGDAELTLDGVPFTRATNSIGNLVPGITLELTGTSATPVTLGSTPPTAALSQVVNDVVDTYNELFAILKTEADPANGNLRADPGVRTMARRLQQLTLTKLLTANTDGGPRTLAEIGVATNRNGTLSVQADKLAAAIKNYPAAVEAMFADGTGASEHGLSGALTALSSELTSRTAGLGASESRYTAAQSTLTAEQARAAEQADTMRQRLTRQFASMDARVAAYKSTQTFLEQQVDAWNRD